MSDLALCVCALLAPAANRIALGLNDVFYYRAEIHVRESESERDQKRCQSVAIEYQERKTDMLNNSTIYSTHFKEEFAKWLHISRACCLGGQQHTIAKGLQSIGNQFQTLWVLNLLYGCLLL